METDFRTKLQIVLSEDASKYIYFESDTRHYIVANIPTNASKAAIATLVEAMQDNQSLMIMKEGVDYDWEGASMISFTDKTHAALFSLCLPY